MPETQPQSNAELRERLRELEWENRRLRDAVGDSGLTPEVAAWFDPTAFKRINKRLHMWIGIGGVPIWVGMVLLFFILPVFGGMNLVPRTMIGPVPLVDLAGTATGWYGLGFGIVAMGGFSVGVFAFGGGAFGVFAYGGGAAGIVALGGGAAGFVAIGGAAFGYVAIGGSCYGYYAMGERAHGKYALGLNRQDEEAAAFFRRYIPGLGVAVSKPIPVILGDGARA